MHPLIDIAVSIYKSKRVRYAFGALLHYGPNFLALIVSLLLYLPLFFTQPWGSWHYCFFALLLVWFVDGVTKCVRGFSNRWLETIGKILLMVSSGLFVWHGLVPLIKSSWTVFLEIRKLGWSNIGFRSKAGLLWAPISLLVPLYNTCTWYSSLPEYQMNGKFKRSYRQRPDFQHFVMPSNMLEIGSSVMSAFMNYNNPRSMSIQLANAFLSLIRPNIKYNGHKFSALALVACAMGLVSLYAALGSLQSQLVQVRNGINSATIQPSVTKISS